jgi:hypothetical protein
MRAALILLAMLVVLLGAAAKHSQFDGPPHHGYLSKAVKMAGARINPEAGTETVYLVSSPATQFSPELECTERARCVITNDHVFVSIFSPPLRV